MTACANPSINATPRVSGVYPSSNLSIKKTKLVFVSDKASLSAASIASSSRFSVKSATRVPGGSLGFIEFFNFFLRLLAGVFSFNQCLRCSKAFELTCLEFL